MPNRAAALFDRAEKMPEKIAVIFENKTWTYLELLNEARAFAAGLSKAGFGKGDKLGLMIATRPQFIALEYATFILGGTIAPMNVHYQGNEIEHALVSCDVQFLVIDNDCAHHLKPDFEARCTSLRKVFVFGSTFEFDLFNDAESLRSDPSLALPPVDLDPQDTALMLYTSATTGKAKGVMLSLANLESNHDASPGWLHLASDEVILCALPLYNTFGLNQCINATIYLGATLVLLPKFDPLTVLQSVQNWQCTFFPAVPTMLQRVLDFPEVDQFDLTSLRRFCVGAAPVPGPLLVKLRQRIAKDSIVIHGYGLTESSALVTTIQVVLDENGSVRNAKSIGRVLPGIEMRIVDENDTIAKLGQVGEICIKGPCVMKGYYNAPEATAEAIVDGWLHTGDLGTMDAQGFFNIVDRKKDLIIRGGQNIYPVDIEEILYNHPFVVEAAVIARPDEALGEVPVAFVSLKSNAMVTVDELLALCKSELAYYKIPASIQILPELPKGPTGKILRRALRAH